MMINELTQALHDLARGFAHFLPRLIVMLILALVGWMIAYVVKVGLGGILGLIKFEKLSENAGASQLLTKAALPPATEMLGRFVFWVTWLGFILLGVSVLGIFSRAALLAAVNANVLAPRVLSLVVRIILIVFVSSLAFGELGLARQTMLVAFGIAFGALMLGLAFAFGIGGRDLAQRFLEKKFVRREKEENDDELSPL
jgi:hypothetical protein